MNELNLKFKKMITSINAKFFIRYIIAFAFIFTTLGFIVTQVLLQTAYSSIDKNLKELSENPQKLYSLYIKNSNENNNYSEIDGRLDITVKIIFWDDMGQQLAPPLQNNSSLYNAVFSDLEFSENSLDSIVNLKLINQYGQKSEFRSLTRKFIVSEDVSTNIAYFQILVNINQINESVLRFRGIIEYTMIAFWLISIIISWYLTRMSMRPIIKNWENQRAFVSNASHELRTPLAILQNRLERLFQKPDSTILENSENIAESLNEVRNMRFLMNNLLSLAKQEEEKLELSPESIDKEFFEVISGDCSELAELENKGFSAEISEIKGYKHDKQIIKQLITILFDNAMKYTNENGEIELIVTQIRKDLIISVKDNGVGISDGEKNKIFERFYRVDQARTRSKGGVGLGLSLLKQVVDIVKGRVDVYDNFPKGSVFKITLPSIDKK